MGQRADWLTTRSASSSYTDILQDRQYTYNVTSWRVRVIFVPPGICYKPDNISLEKSAFIDDTISPGTIQLIEVFTGQDIFARF